MTGHENVLATDQEVVAVVRALIVRSALHGSSNEEEVRRIALSLPGAAEEPDNHLPGFRVRTDVCSHSRAPRLNNRARRAASQAGQYRASEGI
jgi:plasmid stability protein